MSGGLTIMTGHIQPPRITGNGTVTTVFLRPSFRITTRDGSLDVAVKAETPSTGTGSEGAAADTPASGDGEAPANDDGKDRTLARMSSWRGARA